MKYEPTNRLVRQASKPSAAAAVGLQQSFESLVISANGGVLITGWMNDYVSPVDFIRVIGATWSLTFDAETLARFRRQDVESTLGTFIRYNFGYLGFIAVGEKIDARGTFKIEIGLKEGGLATLVTEARFVDDADLRDAALSYISTAQHFGNPQVQSIACIDGGVGSELVAFNRGITSRDRILKLYRAIWTATAQASRIHRRLPVWQERISIPAECLVLRQTGDRRL